MLPQGVVAGDGAPTTVNQAALAQRIRAAMRAGMGDAAVMPRQQIDMHAEGGIDPQIPGVYSEVGGTPPGQLASGQRAEHRWPLFRIVPEPSIRAGVEAMTLTALDPLGAGTDD